MATPGIANVLAPFFRSRYEDKNNVNKLLYTDNPTLAWLAKDTNLGGDGTFTCPVMVGDPRSVAPTRAAVQTRMKTSGGGTRGAKWICTAGTLKAGHIIKYEDLKLAMKGGADVFLDVQGEATDGIYRSWGDRVETLLWLPPGRALTSGTISSGVVTITATNGKWDLRKIAIGDILEVSANDGSSTGHALLTANVGYVIGIDYENSKFTVSATDGGAAGTPTDWTGTMYFFHKDEFGGTATPAAEIDSIPLWLPAATPSATSFRNVVRTVDPVRYSGVRILAAEVASNSWDIQECLKQLMLRMSVYGFKVGERKGFLHPYDFQRLCDSLETKGVRDFMTKDPVFGFESARLRTAAGSLDFIAASKAPLGEARILDKGAMKLKTCGEFPEVVDIDGNTIRVETTTDDPEYRLTGTGLFIMQAPGACGVTALPA